MKARLCTKLKGETVRLFMVQNNITRYSIVKLHQVTN